MPVNHTIPTQHRDTGRGHAMDANDPVLAMLGVGSQLWELEQGDSFVDRLRSEDLPAPPVAQPSSAPARNLTEIVWQRIVSHQGEQFHTVKGLPFTFEVAGSGIWFFRGEKRVNRKATRTQFEVALSRCPLKRTTEIRDLMDYPYLTYSLCWLTDEYAARNGDGESLLGHESLHLFVREEC